MKSIVSLVVLLVALMPGRYAPGAEEELNWRTSFPVEKDEDGEKMIVSGTVYDEDGNTPLAGVVVYAYHTDAKGYYSYHGSGNRNPRLKGWMRTNDEGRYEFESIRPAPYPQGSIPAHVHYVVTRPDEREQSFELVFEGDPLVSDRVRDRAKEGGFWIVSAIERNDEGAWSCAADLVLYSK